jgi:hypothetical protein
MQNTNYHLNEIFQNCRELHIIRTQSEFSALCGRTPHWFSSCKSQNLPASTEALLMLSFKINTAIKSSVPKHLRSRVKSLNQNIAALLTQRMLTD